MKKILVVDDSSTMRKIIRRTLRQTGLAFDDVLEAENGIEALSVLASDPAIRVVALKFGLYCCTCSHV